MQDAQFESMWSGHRMIWNRWSPHMKGNTITMFLLQGIAAMSAMGTQVLHQHQHPKLTPPYQSHHKLMMACRGSTGLHLSTLSAFPAGRLWVPILASLLGSISPARPTWRWQGLLRGKGRCLSCLFIHIWGNNEKWMRGPSWCPKESPRRSWYQSLLCPSRTGHSIIRSWAGCL